MRLWHYKLLPYLPKKQLVSQWRELNAIFKSNEKFILINYVYDYDKTDLLSYTNMVLKEIEERGIKVKSYKNYENYFQDLTRSQELVEKPFPKHQNNRYLIQCFYNLQEKYDRGQKDFTRDLYIKLETDLSKLLKE